MSRYVYSATITHRRRGIYLVQVAEHSDGVSEADAFTNLRDAKAWAESWCDGYLPGWERVGTRMWSAASDAS